MVLNADGGRFRRYRRDNLVGHCQGQIKQDFIGRAELGTRHSRDGIVLPPFFGKALFVLGALLLAALVVGLGSIALGLVLG